MFGLIQMNVNNVVFSSLDDVRKDLCHHYASAVRRPPCFGITHELFSELISNFT